MNCVIRGDSPLRCKSWRITKGFRTNKGENAPLYIPRTNKGARPLVYPFDD